jgi:hypothetical protein
MFFTTFLEEVKKTTITLIDCGVSSLVYSVVTFSMLLDNTSYWTKSTKNCITLADHL